MQERKRNLTRLEKLRNGLALLDKQLDALRSSEIDKELMNSLRISSQAMKQAGIGVGVEEAETVMNELDDQIREASELTSVLATPLVNKLGGSDEDILDADVDIELGLIAEEDSAMILNGIGTPSENAQTIPDPPARRPSMERASSSASEQRAPATSLMAAEPANVMEQYHERPRQSERVQPVVTMLSTEYYDK